MAGLLLVAAGCGSDAKQQPATTGTVSAKDAGLWADAWILYFGKSPTPTDRACLHQVFANLTPEQLKMVNDFTSTRSKDFEDKWQTDLAACHFTD